MLETPSLLFELWTTPLVTVHMAVLFMNLYATNDITNQALAGVALLKVSGLCNVLLPLEHYETVLCCFPPSPANKDHTGKDCREYQFSPDRCSLAE